MIFATFCGELRAHLTLVSLSEPEYLQAIEEAAAANLAGAAICAALLAHWALKAKAKTIYTGNAKDFLRLPPDIAGRLRQPNQ